MWRTRCPCPCFAFLSGLSCTTYICIWLPSLPYAYYMWLPWFVSFMFLGFPSPESLPGDDVLCRLLPRPLSSVCFLFLFSNRVRPDLFWCNFPYLVTTAGFVADQLIMRDKQQRVRLCVIFCVLFFTLSSSCDIGEPGMGSAPLSFLGS